MASEQLGANLSPILDSVAKDLGERKVQINLIGEGPLYTTKITVNGDIICEFSKSPPTSNDDPYWAQHIELVGKIIDNRKAIIEKLIDKDLFSIKIGGD